MINHEFINFVNTMQFNSQLRPNYEAIKSCLIWPDEVPDFFSRENREFLYDLLIVRGFLHKNIPADKEHWGFDPAYLLAAWYEGQRLVPNWPGFRRVNISDEDRKYLNDSMVMDKDLS
jgi:hypothetical protein